MSGKDLNGLNGPSAADLFDLLWETLSDVLGTAATAALLRRSIKQVAARISWSEPVVVERDHVDYVYRVPETWKRPDNEEAVRELRDLAAQLRILLVEMTGPVVVKRLARLSPFRERGIEFHEEAPSA